MIRRAPRSISCHMSTAAALGQCGGFVGDIFLLQRDKQLLGAVLNHSRFAQLDGAHRTETAEANINKELEAINGHDVDHVVPVATIINISYDTGKTEDSCSPSTILRSFPASVPRHRLYSLIDSRRGSHHVVSKSPQHGGKQQVILEAPSTTPATTANNFIEDVVDVQANMFARGIVQVEILKRNGAELMGYEC